MSTPATDATARIDLLGCPVDALTMDQTVARVEEAIARRQTTQHVAINAAKVVRYQHDETLRAAVDGCELATADGQSVVWASRILGRPLPERVAGIDLMDALLGAARERGYGVFLLGARAEVLERAEQEILRRHPGVRIVGRHHGYFGAEGEADVVDEVAAAAPDILFVALETPAKELFLARNRERMQLPFVMGVGGSFDVLAGEQDARAPLDAQRRARVVLPARPGPAAACAGGTGRERRVHHLGFQRFLTEPEVKPRGSA